MHSGYTGRSLASTPKISANADGKQPYWWSIEIQQEVKRVKKKRRKFQREEDWIKRKNVHDEYVTEKKG